MDDSKVVKFEPSEFKEMYPQFENISDSVLTMYFNAATLLLNNTDKSVVTDLSERKFLLYMLTCHIATLKGRGDALVGTVTSAAEGKVNVSVTALNNANWYTQTVCGSLFWQATAKYRRGMRYCVYCKS